MEQNKEKITDPVSRGIYEIFRKWKVPPHTTIFYTSGEGGSEENLRKLKKKFSALIQHMEGVEISAFDADKNIVKIGHHINERFREVNKEKDFYIIVNPTTGTNPMSIALFSAVVDNSVRTLS